MKPFNTVESVSFKNFCSALDPKFEMPSKTTISQVVIPKMYQETKSKVQDLLATCAGLAVTADGWTSQANQSYTTLTSHFIDENGTLSI